MRSDFVSGMTAFSQTELVSCNSGVDLLHVWIWDKGGQPLKIDAWRGGSTT
jgi:hypothetical protein